MTDDPKDPPVTDDDGWGDAAEVEKPEPKPEPKPEQKTEREPAAAGPEPPAKPRAKSPERDYEPEAYAPPASTDVRSAVLDDDEPPAKTGSLFGRQKKPPKDRAKRHRAHATVVSGKKTLWVIGIGAAIMIFGVCAVLSWLNSSGFYLVCKPTKIVAERGRWLPWGHTSLTGRAWTPVAKPEDARCKDRRFNDLGGLKAAFSSALKARASNALAEATQKNISAEALELADKQLSQALLLLRDADNDDERKELLRLQGDVEYWRAAASVSSAIDNLTEAGKRFDEAASRGPRHAGDSSTWAEYARELGDQLRQGPPSLRPEQPAAPGSAPPFSGTGNAVDKAPDADAGPQTGAPPPDPPDAGPAVPDAGPPDLPTGGVLL